MIRFTAIRLAENGFVLTEEEARELHDPDLAKFPASHQIFQQSAKRGSYYDAGDTFRQPELAATLQRIAANPDDLAAYEEPMFARSHAAARLAHRIQELCLGPDAPASFIRLLAGPLQA